MSQSKKSKGQKVKRIGWGEVVEVTKLLSEEIKKKKMKINSIWGVPRGGLIPAVLLSHLLNKWLVVNEDRIDEFTLIVDDVVDDGRILSWSKKERPKNCFVTLFKRGKSSIEPDAAGMEILSDCWLSLPWEKKYE